MKDKFVFGIIGCGMVSHIHAKAIQSLDRGELRGIADYLPEKAEAFAEEYNVKAYPDSNALLQDPDIDIVCICTPSGFHADQAMAALHCGKHVVLEKPMALTTESAEKIVEACDRQNCFLTVISQNRFSSDVQYVKNLYDQGAFGKSVFCSLYMKYWRTPEYYSSSKWKGTKQFDGGGALMNQGIHGIDLLQYIAGEAKVIKGKVKTRSHSIEVEDTAVAMLEFSDGALGVVEASTCTYPGFSRRLEIMGNKGYVVLKENTIQELVVDQKPVDLPERGEADLSISADPKKLDFKMHAKQIENLIDAIQGKDELLIGAREGCHAVKLINEIYHSSEMY